MLSFLQNIPQKKMFQQLENHKLQFLMKGQHCDPFSIPTISPLIQLFTSHGRGRKSIQFIGKRQFCWLGRRARVRVIASLTAIRQIMIYLHLDLYRRLPDQRGLYQD